MYPQKSTIVQLSPTAPTRPAVGRQQRALRSAFGRLEHLAPALSARLAAYLWFRLPRPPEPERRRRRMPVGGWPLDLDLPGIGRIRGVEFGPDEGPLALLVHGWAGWREQLSAFIEPLTTQGFRVVSVDLPGHGESGPGRHGRGTTTAPAMAEALAAVGKVLGPIDLAVGHSLGAMTLLLAAARLELRVGAVVLIAPVASVPPVVDTFQARCGFGPETRHRLIPLLERRSGVTLGDFEVTGMLGGLFTCGPVPMLAVHDVDDQEIPVAGAKEIAAAWPGAELLVTEGLGHRRVLWDPEVVRRVADFALGLPARAG